MATTTYFEYVIDPATGNRIEVRDRYAREMGLKTEKTFVNSLPAKPTTKDQWLVMEPYLYYVPIEGKDNDYEVWSLFFEGDPTVASDYTDPSNYTWLKVVTTDVDMSGISTKGHTHEVIPETEVEDHEYTPQGSVDGIFTGYTQNTQNNGAHTHSVTVPAQTIQNEQISGTSGTTGAGEKHKHAVDFPSVSVSGTLSGTVDTTSTGSQHRHSVDFPSVSISGTLSGTEGETGAGSSHRHSVDFPSVNISGTLSGTAGTTSSNSGHTHGVTPTKKKLVTSKLNITPATAVDFTGSTIHAQRATGYLEELSPYDPDKAVFNGIRVQDGVLSFVTKKMTTADTVSGLSATVDASKVTYGSSGTVSNADVATGALTDGETGDPLVLTDVSVNTENSHTHGFTPAGTVSGTTSSTSDYTGYEDKHTHSFTPAGTVSGTTSSATDYTGYESGHTHGFTPAGTVSGTTSATSGYTEDESEHTHGFTPQGTVSITIPSQTISQTGEAGSHNHEYTPGGSVSASFTGLRTNLKHKVDNKKVRTAPDTEDEGSHAFDWYGILFDEDGTDPIKTRVGNMDMHRMLPIQTKMRRCLLKDDGEVYNYLDQNNTLYYAQGSKDPIGRDLSGQLASLGGTVSYLDETGNKTITINAQVMVEIPEHWRKVYRYKDGDGDNAPYMVKAMISPYPQETTGWIHVKKGYISAYEANIDANNKLCSTSDIKDLVLSVVDGKVNATCDVSVASAQSDITSLLPTTGITMNTLRTAARSRGNEGEYKWNILVYEQYLALYWLYVIEYANLDSQAAFTTALTAEGFHQGGLGNGATTVSSDNWGTFNTYKPFVPCGITNCLGNQSGEVLLALPSTFGTNAKIAVNSYRGVELPFGHIWEFADGIKYLGDGTQQAVLRCGTPANYSSGSNSNNYTSIGNNVGNDGYKKKIMIGDDGDINCKGVGGGSNNAYCDYNYQAHGSGSYYCCLLGGSAYYGSAAGLACVRSSAGVSYSDASFGSRLCFYNV